MALGIRVLDVPGESRASCINVTYSALMAVLKKTKNTKKN
jgi:hypothetical protein